MKETDDPDMLDNYDFSQGVPNKYATRYAQSSISFKPDAARMGQLSSMAFEERARRVMSDYYGVDLLPSIVSGVHKKFDFVSPDGQVIGDAKHYSLVGGTRRPPAKLSTVTEYVWLLEKTEAPNTFLVFGNDRRVPELWLRDYGALLSDVKFYFLDDDNRLELLTGVHVARHVG